MTGRIAGAIPGLLIQAVQDGNAADVESLLEIGADFNERDNNGRSALMVAASGGNTEIVRLLLDNGAEVNATNDNNWTALHYAASSGKSLESMRLLIDRGARTGIMTTDGDTAESIALIRGHGEMVQLLKAKPVDNTDVREELYQKLKRAVVDNNVKRIQILLNPGIDLTEALREGLAGTLLERAAMNGYTEIAGLLMAHGADVNGCNFYGWTPLMQAAVFNHVETSALLIENGADMNLQHECGYTALMFSIGSKHGQDVARLLLGEGADVSIMNSEGKTALDLAKSGDERCGVEVMQLLKAAEFVKASHAAAVQKQQNLKACAPKPVMIRGMKP